jgi:hypothetical protein
MVGIPVAEVSLFLKKTNAIVTTAALALSLSPALQAADAGGAGKRGGVRHVLLISIDGMHAVDFMNCKNGISSINDGAPYCPALAELGTTGINYVAGSTTKPSDSFPGLMGIISGATPRTMGVYYDVAYDRSLDAPAKTTGNGVAGSPGACVAGAPPTGTTTEYEEGIDLDQSKLNGGTSLGVTDGGASAIDPTRLPRDPANNCAPVYPWNFVRDNTIFGVIHEAGGYTAWADKHPAYSSVNGPGSGTNLDDFYSPEINSTVINLPGVKTALEMSCASIPDPNADLTAWTNSFKNIQCYDTLKVDAILNQIQGKTHLGARATVPTVFGMNSQAVSVGEKLIEKPTSGGYLDAMGTPGPALLNEIEYVDASIGKMVTELKKKGLYESTLVIITAKHGQSPIDPNRFFPIPGHSGNNGTTPATLLANAGYIPDSESPLNPTGIGATEDDVSLLWLKEPSDTEAAVKLLEENSKEAGIGIIYVGPTLKTLFDTPGLPPHDPRTPDIAIAPNVGVTYTGSSKKLTEHGGFSHDDTNVMILLSNPALSPKRVSAAVETIQIAPTILKVLGLDPRKLDGVRKEGTGVLPDVPFDLLNQ